MNLGAVKARLGSIPPAKRVEIALISTAADRLLEDVKGLVALCQGLRDHIRSLDADKLQIEINNRSQRYKPAQKG